MLTKECFGIDGSVGFLQQLDLKNNKQNMGTLKPIRD